MTRQYHLGSVLLERGWSRHVNVTVADGGLITAIDQGVAPPDAEHIGGIVIPGMPNAHSHAFQRAMAGYCRVPQRCAQDSFWTWRDAMYRLANRLEPSELQAIATQLFVEMLQSRLHLRGGVSLPAPPQRRFGLRRRQRAVERGPRRGRGHRHRPDAAADLVSGRRFRRRRRSNRSSGASCSTRDAFVRAIDDLRRADAVFPHGTASAPAGAVTGAAFHSLRAVPLPVLQEVAARCAPSTHACRCTSMWPSRCARSTPASHSRAGGPIELLLHTGLVDAHWCLVHCTHASAAELKGIAATGAAVCVSVTTEANLGDGLFDRRRPSSVARGRLCVGSDSQSTVSPAEELRWLEYQQRLRRRRRAVLATGRSPMSGRGCGARPRATGADALGQPAGRIAVGRRADWLVLDPAHASLAGASLEGTLDHVIFAGADRAIADVMVAGRWVVRDGRHPHAAAAASAFAALQHRLQIT